MEPRAFETGEQYFLIPGWPVALRQRRPFDAPQFHDLAEAAALVELQRAFAIAHEIEKRGGAHGETPEFLTIGPQSTLLLRQPQDTVANRTAVQHRLCLSQWRPCRSLP